MAKKRKKWTPEERAAWEERFERTQAMLKARIDHYEAKIRAKGEESK